jgi:hypothetical protein
MVMGPIKLSLDKIPDPGLRCLGAVAFEPLRRISRDEGPLSWGMTKLYQGREQFRTLALDVCIVWPAQ